MEKIKYISKQWSLTARDWLKSLYYGFIMPVITEILTQAINYILSIFQLGSLEVSPKQLIIIGIGAILAHISRKLAEPTKKVEITKISEEDGNDSFFNSNNNYRTNPPPVGDPTHPKK